MGSSRFAPRPRNIRSLSTDSSVEFSVQSVEIGNQGSLDYRVLFLDDKWQRQMSPWHDVPLQAQGGLLSFVCKTPAGSWVRLESSPDEPFNPLRVTKTACHLSELGGEELFNRRRSQDYSIEGRKNSKSGRLLPSGSPDFTEREKGRGGLKECSDKCWCARPSHYPDNAPWNMGCLPQTWTRCGFEGDGASMLEVIDIGLCKLRHVGEVYLVKPLGAFRVEDRGEVASWKVIVIAADDPMAELFHDSKDVHLHLPGIWDQLRDWVKTSAAGKKGVRKSGIYVSRPCQLSLTQAKIAACYEAWRQYSTRQPAFRQSLALRLPSPITKKVLRAAWAKYLPKDQYSPGVIPLSCPATLSSTFWDPSWTEVQPLHDKIIVSGRLVSEKGENIPMPSSPPLRGLFTLWNRVLRSKNKESGRPKLSGKQKPPLREIPLSQNRPPTSAVSLVPPSSRFVQGESKHSEVSDTMKQFCQTPGRSEEDDDEELYSRLTRSNTEPMSRETFNPYHVSRTPLPAHWTPAVVFPRRGLRY